jgi:hypothetical protein
MAQVVALFPNGPGEPKGIAGAIRSRRLLRFDYDGYARTVEPHVYGFGRKNRKLLRAYQVGGGSESAASAGWKLFFEDEMSAIAVGTETFAGPRPEYRKDDPAIQRVIAQL